MRSILMATLLAGCGPKTPEGVWVWKEVREKNAAGGYDVTTAITEADLEWKVGPMGWPGCPQGISCLHHGNFVLLVQGERYHIMQRVTTGSDFQQFGTVTYANGLLTFTREEEYSCAHPLVDQSGYSKPATLYARLRAEGSDLWMSQLSPTDPGQAPQQFTVLRASTKEAYANYDLKFCGIGREGATECHCLCASQDVLRDFACE